MLKHKPLLISALARDTQTFFEDADKQLAAIKGNFHIIFTKIFIEFDQVKRFNFQSLNIS